MMFIVLTFGSSETARALNTDPSELASGLCPSRAGADSPFFVCWQTGINPISACANTRKARACHPLGGIFVKRAAKSAVFLTLQRRASFSDTQRTLYRFESTRRAFGKSIRFSSR
jgi:hypothetical protein